MADLKPLGNRWPCCNGPTGLHTGHYHEGDEIERMCKLCRAEYTITFEIVTVKNLGKFLKLHFTRKLVDA
jgi:IS5 family transposase